MTSAPTIRTTTTAHAAAGPRTGKAGYGRARTHAHRFGAPLLALGLGLALTACGAVGPGTSTPEPTETTAAAPSTAQPDADAAAECTDVQQTIANLEERLAGFGEKLPGDIPGAIADVETSITEITTLKDRVKDGELRTLLTDVIDRGGEALTILEQAQSGEITVLEALAQGTAKLTEVQAALESISTYCDQA